ncbi:Plasmodium vivax Vir protein, putative [Plasmodium ovale]|uniref:Plasmodium vivax Vir protein, putative n=1 Tax=Plasmodium ovale TaxID=36330 RepID=A0A1C3KKA1_PLAOA|nr:Plasmodium vivax Vir protein, putative [Plasmodium ovale]
MPELDNDLAILPSFWFYAILDKGAEYPHAHDEFFGDLDLSMAKNESISKISKNLLYAFHYVSKMKQSDNEFTERWNYLYYWFGSQLYNHIDDPLKFPIIMNILDSVKKEVDSNKGYDKEFFEITKEEFINLKEIYDYSQNYDAIILKTAPANFVCSREYNNYIHKSYKLYRTLTLECTSDIKAYCRIFRNINNNYLNGKSSKLKCHHIKDSVSSSELGHSNLQGSEQSPHSLPSGHRQSLHNPESGSFIHDSSHLKEDETSPTNSPHAAAIIFPVFGFLIIFFILYKFTPLGTFIHSHFIRKKINHWEAEANTLDESSTQKYEHECDNSVINSHHIGYNPIGNR